MMPLIIFPNTDHQTFNCIQKGAQHIEVLFFFTKEFVTFAGLKERSASQCRDSEKLLQGVGVKCYLGPCPARASWAAPRGDRLLSGASIQGAVARDESWRQSSSVTSGTEATDSSPAIQFRGQQQGKGVAKGDRGFGLKCRHRH